MKQFVRIIAAMATFAIVAPAQAQDFPSRQVTLLVPQAPGASSDLAARTLSERLQAAWGQPVIVDNRAGAGGNVGAGIAARAPADGYTLMIGTDAMMTSNTYLYKTVPFDPVKDFAPVTNVATNIISLSVNAELPVKSIPELIAYAKANPGKLKYGTPGAGSPHHLAGELLALKAGINLVHVPYRGGAASVNDLLGGHINMGFVSLSAAVPQLATGKIRILAIVEKSRYAAMPDVPTVAETVPGFEMSSWLGVFAPAATPAPIIARVNATVTKVLLEPAVKDKLGAMGLVVAPGTPADLAAIVKDGLAVRGALIKAAGIQPE